MDDRQEKLFGEREKTQTREAIRLVLITPTWRGDVERFALLRESLDLFFPGRPHLVVVHTEDMPMIRERFGRIPGLDLVSTADVLPRDIESRRVRSGASSVRERWQRLRYGPPWDGWRVQQLSKIFALRGCGDRIGAAFIDSDVFACAPLAVEDFMVGDRLKLYRRPARDAESLAFAVTAHDILGHRLDRIRQLDDHIFQPACFLGATARALVDDMSERFGAQWTERIRRQARPSEYDLLGETARIRGDDGYIVVHCEPDDVHYSIRYEEDVQRLEHPENPVERDGRKFFLVQSNLGLPDTALQRVARSIMQSRHRRLQADRPC